MLTQFRDLPALFFRSARLLGLQFAAQISTEQENKLSDEHSIQER